MLEFKVKKLKIKCFHSEVDYNVISLASTVKLSILPKRLILACAMEWRAARQRGIQGRRVVHNLRPVESVGIGYELVERDRSESGVRGHAHTHTTRTSATQSTALTSGPITHQQEDHQYQAISLANAQIKGSLNTSADNLVNINMSFNIAEMLLVETGFVRLYRGLT